MSKLPHGVQISRIINYLRRSREDLEREKRTGEDTILMQKEVMDRLLSDYALPFDQVIEMGSGEKIDTRPVFQQVLADLQADKYNCIAVKEISRLTRGDFKDYGVLYELIKQKRIYILTPYRLYDPKNVNDMRQIRFEMFLSREEFETIRERMQSAKYAYALSGKFMGSKPAFGYRANPKTQRLEIHADEANLVRLIYDLYLHGMAGKELGLRAIASFLTKASIPSPSGLPRWNPPAVKKILRNPVYTGEIRYSTTTEINNRRRVKPEAEWIIVKEAHEPIISRELFLQAERKTAQKNSPPPTRKDRTATELSGLIICATCSRRMVRQTAKSIYVKKDGSKSVYEKEMLWCTTPGCTYVKYRAVEEMLVQFLSRVQAPRDIAPFFADDHQSASIQMGPSSAPARSFFSWRQLEILQKQHIELTERLDMIYRNFEAGIYSQEEFEQRRSTMRSELSRIDELMKLAGSEKQLEDLSLEKVEWKGIFTSFSSVYVRLPTKVDKNKLLRTLIESVSLHLREKGKGSKPAHFDVHIALRFPEYLKIES